MKREVELSGRPSGQERRRNLAPGFPHVVFAAETMRYLPEARSDAGILQGRNMSEKRGNVRINFCIETGIYTDL
jgi:hypothetical protein